MAHRYTGSMKVRYNYRLRPGATAEAWLLREWGMCRYVWNQLVERSNDIYALRDTAALAGAAPLTFGMADASKFVTYLRATTTDPETGEKWLSTGSSEAQKNTMRDFSAARAKALKDISSRSTPTGKKRGMPRFKKRDRALPSMNFTRGKFSLKPDSDGKLQLVLPRGTRIPVVWSRELPSAPSSVRVSRDSLGDWYASFVVEVEHDALPPTGQDVAIGVDWGVKETATTARVDMRTGIADYTTEFDLPHSQHGKAMAGALASAQRKMARRKPDPGKAASHGYRLAKFQAAKLHKKAARKRTDDANKWAHRVVAAHDALAVEDFKPKFLAKSNMARKASDAAISQTKQALEWQALKAGRELRLVNPAYTTMDCADCGARTKRRLSLGERTYACEACGSVRPRDKNSAAVMVARAGLSPVGAEGVRPRLDAIPALAS